MSYVISISALRKKAMPVKTEFSVSVCDFAEFNNAICEAFRKRWLVNTCASSAVLCEGVSSFEEVGAILLGWSADKSSVCFKQLMDSYLPSGYSFYFESAKFFVKINEFQK